MILLRSISSAHDNAALRLCFHFAFALKLEDEEEVAIDRVVIMNVRVSIGKKIENKKKDTKIRTLNVNLNSSDRYHA